MKQVKKKKPKKTKKELICLVHAAPNRGGGHVADTVFLGKFAFARDHDRLVFIIGHHEQLFRHFLRISAAQHATHRPHAFQFFLRQQQIFSARTGTVERT